MSNQDSSRTTTQTPTIVDRHQHPSAPELTYYTGQGACYATRKRMESERRAVALYGEAVAG